MPAEMWLPLLFTVLGFYCFFGAVLLMRMRLDVLKRETRAGWVKDELSRQLGPGSKPSSGPAPSRNGSKR
jgi:heme exporter protein C